MQTTLFGIYNVCFTAQVDHNRLLKKDYVMKNFDIEIYCIYLHNCCIIKTVNI